MQNSKKSTHGSSKTSSSANPYEGLPHIDDTQEPLAEEQAQLERLAAFMKAEGMTEKFGITLLHKHFELANDEMLVEFCDPETRTLTIRPIQQTELTTLDQVPRETQWRWDNVSGLLCVVQCLNSGNGHGIGHFPLLNQ